MCFYECLCQSMRSSHSNFIWRRWHKIGWRTILFTLDHSVVAWEQGGRWPLRHPTLAGSRTWSPHPQRWHSSAPRCQQDRGHTRMSKSERRNCWNYTFNFHQAGSQWWGSGPVSPGPPHTGRAGCLLLCNGQQDTRFKLMHHNGTQLSIISTPG